MSTLWLLGQAPPDWPPRSRLTIMEHTGLVAEAENVVGGSSRLSGGLIMGAGTRYQTAAGISDDGAALFHEYMNINRWNVDAGTVRRSCDESGAVVNWLGDLGVEFHPQLVVAGDELTPRVYVPIGAGKPSSTSFTAIAVSAASTLRSANGPTAS